jgi:hypothetical protein
VHLRLKITPIRVCLYVCMCVRMCVCSCGTLDGVFVCFNMFIEIRRIVDDNAISLG